MRPTRRGAEDFDEDAQRLDAVRGVRVRDVESEDLPNLPIREAVARICLNAIRHRLPQWTAMAEGRLVRGRHREAGRGAIVPLLPRFLFEINWADTAPGLSWPDAYHATFVPGFDRYVVTTSSDSTDSFGVNDFALGHFEIRSRVVDRG